VGIVLVSESDDKEGSFRIIDSKILLGSVTEDGEYIGSGFIWPISTSKTCFLQVSSGGGISVSIILCMDDVGRGFNRIVGVGLDASRFSSLLSTFSSSLIFSSFKHDK